MEVIAQNPAAILLGITMLAALCMLGLNAAEGGSAHAMHAKNLSEKMSACFGELEVLQGKVAELEKAEEPDEEALKAAREAYQAKAQEFDGLKPQLEQAKANAARFDLLRQAEELAAQRRQGKQFVPPTEQDPMAAEPTDHIARGKAHVQAFEFWANGMEGKISGRQWNELLMPADPRKRKFAGKNSIVMPKPLAALVIGGHRGKAMLAEAKAMLSSSTSEGYTVPTHDIEELLRLPSEVATLYQMVRQLPMRNNVAYIPRLKQVDRSTSGDGTPGINDGDLAGVAITLGDSEGDQYNETEASFEQETLNTYRLDAKTQVSDEFERRSFLNIGAFINEMFVLGIQNAFDWLIINGSGSSQATGYRNDGNIETVTRQTVATCTPKDLTELEFGILPQYRGENCVYVMSDNALKKLRLTEDSDGYPVLTRSYQGGPLNRLNGYRFVSTTRAPAAGVDGDMAFMNPRAYGFAVEEEMMVGRSEHQYFDQGEVVYVVRAWVGGKPITPRAIAMLDNEAS
jgi:HK97 family phage major capsid protein